MRRGAPRGRPNIGDDSEKKLFNEIKSPYQMDFSCVQDIDLSSKP
jgi:hypothetical protein